jgi:transcriptional regulator of acetoin/glycerol metabolism
VNFGLICTIGLEYFQFEPRRFASAAATFRYSCGSLFPSCNIDSAGYSTKCPQNNDWPGNVRELKNIVERAMILSPGSTLQLGDWFSSQHDVNVVSFGPHEQAGETIEEVERAHMEKVLVACDWKIRGEGGAAERLGLKRTTLQSRMKKLGIQRPTA